jgi:hypothetical protein
MPADDQALEVFRDLNLRGSATQLDAFRAALIERIVPPWVRSEAEERYSASIRGNQDVLVLCREPDLSTPAARVFLWRNDDCYQVSNIVPIETSELGRGDYNNVLNDFILRVAEPAANATGISVEVTGSRQGLENWTTPQVASALRRFSHLANKSTGSAHWLDKERWFEFIVRSHDYEKPLDTNQLGRWLVEVENWSEDKAHELVLEYEFGQALLEFIGK